MIVSLHKGKHKKTECKHYRSISLLNVVRKVYMALLVDRFRKVNEELTEDEEGVGISDQGGDMRIKFSLENN